MLKNFQQKKLQASIKQDLKVNFSGKTTTALPEQLKTTAKTVLSQFSNSAEI